MRCFTLVIALCLATPAFGAASLETFVIAVGGNSSGPSGCTTSGPPAEVYAFFGPAGVSIPAGGLAPCSIAGGYDDQTSALGPLSDDRALSTSWGANTFDGTTSTMARYGILSSQSHTVYTGTTGGSTIRGSQSFGLCADDFTITSPSVSNGQAAFLRVLVTVTGGLSTTTNGSYADVEVEYKLNGPATQTLFRSQANSTAVNPFVYSVTGTGLAGFTLSPGAMSGSGEVTSLAIPFTFGTPFTFSLGVLTYTIPSSTSTTDADFDAVITGMQVTLPNSQSVTDFVVHTSSGTTYGTGGVTAVGPQAPARAPSLAAFPNPAPGGVTLRFEGPRAVDGSIEIYDPAGRRVRLLPNVRAGVGAAVLWDGRGDDGAFLPSGMYFVRLTWKGGTAATRVTLLR